MSSRHLSESAPLAAGKTTVSEYRMKFLDNTHDPKDPRARFYLSTELRQTHEEAWKMHLQWLEGKIIGDPQPTDTYTVEQLKAMGLVGVYKPD